MSPTFECPSCHTRTPHVTGLCPVCGHIGRGRALCSGDGCERPAYARGLCEPHYLQAYRAEKRGEEPALKPIRSGDDPARAVLSMRVSPAAKARAAADPDGAREAIEAWSRRP